VADSNPNALATFALMDIADLKRNSRDVRQALISEVERCMLSIGVGQLGHGHVYLATSMATEPTYDRFSMFQYT
jgi:hypothetical protein